MLSKEIRTEPGLLRYLHMLLALRGRRHLALLSLPTRVRLQVRARARAGGPGPGAYCTRATLACCCQPGPAFNPAARPATRLPCCRAAAAAARVLPLQGELYMLAQAGGPRYAPRRVNRLAQEALDALFPAGRCAHLMC